jgi:hypothetical protein
VYTAVQLFGDSDRYVRVLPFNLADLRVGNFIHGASLTRRVAYDQTRGYSAINLDSHEDWNLFLSIVECGWKAVAAPNTVLYYRQHGVSRNKTSRLRYRGVVKQIMRDHPELYGPLPSMWFYVVWPYAWLARRAYRYCSRRLGTYSTIEPRGQAMSQLPLPFDAS